MIRLIVNGDTSCHHSIVNMQLRVRIQFPEYSTVIETVVVQVNCLLFTIAGYLVCLEVRVDDFPTRGQDQTKVTTVSVELYFVYTVVRVTTVLRSAFYYSVAQVG